MFIRIFAVYDDKAKAFLPTFNMRSQGEAIRAFQEAVTQEGHNFKKYAQDYNLYFIGEFDDNTGTITSDNGPQEIARGLEIAAKYSEVRIDLDDKFGVVEEEETKNDTSQYVL